MTEDIHELERQTEALLVELGEHLDVDVAGAVVMRAKASVHHEVNERWLGDQSAPRPGHEAIEKVRQAVHGELAIVSRRPYIVRARRLMVPLAAAAMIMVVFGVGYLIRQGGREMPADDSPAMVAAVEAQLDLLAAASDAILDESRPVAEIADELSIVEESIDRWQPASVRDPEVLGELIDEMDSLLEEAGAGPGVSLRRTLPRGAVG